MTFVSVADRNFKAVLDFGGGAAMDLFGAIVEGAGVSPAALLITGTGREGTSTDKWVYQYQGYLVPDWAEGVNQTPAIVGTVIRTIPHGSGKAGVVVSFVAVKHQKGSRVSDHPAFPQTQRVGILVFDNFEPIDVWGFIQAFAIARFQGQGYGGPPPYPFEIVFISNDLAPVTPGAQPAPVKSMNGPRVAPDLFRDQALWEARENRFNVLMIPGGEGSFDLLARPDVKDLMDWVRAMDAHVPLMASVCTGAAILAKSGLLDRQRAATNHAVFGLVASFGPAVLWDNVARWVDADKYVTSAGVSAGTDMAFHLVSRLAGRAVAEAAALAAEYDWHRDPDQPIFYPQQG